MPTAFGSAWGDSHLGRPLGVVLRGVGRHIRNNWLVPVSCFGKFPWYETDPTMILMALVLCCTDPFKRMTIASAGFALGGSKSLLAGAEGNGLWSKSGPT